MQYYLCTVANNEALNRCKLSKFTYKYKSILTIIIHSNYFLAKYSPVHVGVAVHDALVLKGSRALYASWGALPKGSYENFLAKVYTTSSLNNKVLY